MVRPWRQSPAWRFNQRSRSDRASRRSTRAGRARARDRRAAQSAGAAAGRRRRLRARRALRHEENRAKRRTGLPRERDARAPPHARASGSRRDRHADGRGEEEVLQLNREGGVHTSWFLFLRSCSSSNAVNTNREARTETRERLLFMKYRYTKYT